jgi:type II secretory pathway predicted ATPase ExeA
LHEFFRAPLRFDSDESEAEVRAQQAALLADLPATVRRPQRRQLTVGPSGSGDGARLAAVTLAGLG